MEDIFCQIAAGKMQSDVVYKDDKVTAFRDVRPVARTHILIIPNRHIASIAEATEDDAPLLGHMMLVAKRLAEEEGIAASGYRLVINNGPDAGQAVPHLHVHLIGGRELGWPPG